jgi:hypothetical protein
LAREALLACEALLSLLSREALLSRQAGLGTREALLTGQSRLQAFGRPGLALQALLAGQSWLERLALLAREALLARKALLTREALLTCQTLLQASILLEASEALLVAYALVGDLVSMDGGLHDALSRMLFLTLDEWHGSLAVDDRLDFIYYVRHHSLFEARSHLHHSSHRWRRGFLDVPLDVVDHVLVDFPVDDGLHFDYAVLADGFLYDGRVIDGLRSASLLANGGLLDGGLLALLVRASLRLVLVVKLVHDAGHGGEYALLC